MGALVLLETKMQIELNKIYSGNCLDVMRSWSDAFVQTVVTSPPYWGLRDYGVDGQIGLEETPQEYVRKMVEVFREVRRVLKEDGTLWLNMGDSYAADRGGTCMPAETLAGGEHGKSEYADPLRGRQRHGNKQSHRDAPSIGLKHKDMVGIPWLLAFALRADGWYLRCDIIWAKPNPMPESVIDRPTKSHEYLFLMSKSERYFYDNDAIKVPATYGQPNSPESIKSPYGQGFLRRAEKFNKNRNDNGNHRPGGFPSRDKQRGHSRRHVCFNERWDHMERAEQCSGMRNKRSVWTVATSPFSEAHFATFPPGLIKPCILAGSRMGDVVLDPFMGAGTTALVALQYNRQFLGCELNPEYIKIAEKRIANEKAQMKMNL